MRKGLFIGIGLLMVSFGVVPSAWEQGTTSASRQSPATSKITRVLLQQSPVPGTDLETRVYLITFPPGVAGPVHHHPVVGLGYVLQGSFESAFQGDKPSIVHARQSFQDKALVPHILFRNLDKQKPLKFLISYTVKKGVPVILTP